MILRVKAFAAFSPDLPPLLLGLWISICHHAPHIKDKGYEAYQTHDENHNHIRQNKHGIS
jgi:hypothetical protein